MSTSKFAVIGNPIAHSLSPEIHHAFASATNQDISYTKLHAEPDRFTESVESFFAADGSGMNVTAPFKTQAFEWVHSYDDHAGVSHAVNTIGFDSQGSRGFNTDGVGLLRDLARLSWNLADSRVLILGAGGAARGIVAPLLHGGCRLTVANRTLARATELQRQFKELRVTALKQLESGWDVIINATSAMRQNAPLTFDKQIFRGACCYDLGYSRDGKTPFTEAVKDVAMAATDGLGMLVEQAAVAFEIWLGVAPATVPVLRQLRRNPRRFIAGAICTECGQQDTVFVERDTEASTARKACASCGHSEYADGEQAVKLR